MAAILQLRRGTSNASPILTEGELYLHQGAGSIQFGSGSNTYTLLPLSAPANGNINLVGDISASSLTLTGNLTVAQNITFGGTLITFGNANTDNVVITADLSSSIIPNDDNAFDLGASNKKWKNLYAVSASIDSILVPGSGILSSSGISFDLYTASIDTKNSTLANVTASLLSSQTNLNSYTSSQDTKNSTLAIYTASADSRLNNLEIKSGSYATTGSNNFIGNQQITGSLSLSSGQFNVTTGSGALTSSLSFVHNTLDPITGNAILELRYKNNEVGPENNAWKFMASDSGVAIVFEQDGVDRTLLSSNNAGDALIFRDTRLFGKGLTVDNNLSVSQNTQITGSLIVLGGITGSIAATNGVISGSSQIVGILNELNAFSASEETKNSTLATYTGSVTNRLNNLELKSSSVDDTIYEQSIKNSTLGTYTSSLETKNFTLATYTGSIDTKFTAVSSSTSSLNSFTESQDTKNSTLATYTASIDTKWDTLSNVTASVLSYTQSLKDAITVTGQNAASTTTIKGNLIVEGTQTSINSTAIVLGDNIIELNGTGVANGGLLVKDPTGASTISGSLLWDSTNDYWKGGALGVESKIVLMGGDNIVTSSAQIDLTSTTNYVSGIKTRLNVEAVISGSSQVNLNDVTNFSSYSQSVDNRINSLNSYTSLQDTKNSTLATYTASLDTKNSTLGTYTASLETKNSTLAIYTSSLETKNSTLATYTASIDTKWDTLSNVTSSLINATSSYETNGRGIVSGSSQIPSLLPTGVVSGSSQIIYSDISSISVGIVSGSSQVTPLLPNGTISGSSQVIYTSLSSIPAGIVSGSSQIPSLLPSGVVSGSDQLTGSYDLRYAPSASFATLLGANPLASLGTAAFYNVSSSIADGNPNTLGNAFAIKQYVDDTLIAVGAGDITGVYSGNGLSGGADSGSATLTLDTGSAHFINGVDARLIPLTSLNSYTGSQDTKNSTLATYTASLETKNSTLAIYTASVDTLNTAQNNRLTSLETFTGSVPSLTSLNSYTSSQDTKNSTLATYTASVDSQLLNLNAATSSYETKGRGIISGSSQLSGTTITDLTIVNLTTINETASVIFSSGSNRFGDFGNDTHSFTGSVQISGSLTIIGAATATSFDGVINATNGVISGSSQITSVGTLTSLNVSPGAITGSQVGNIIPFYFANQAAFPSATTYHGAIAHSHSDGKMYFAHGGVWNELANANGNISGSSQVTKTLQEVTTAGNTTSTSISITNSTASTSKTTGALIVTGGIGTSGDINAGGDIVAFASSDSRLKNNIRPIESPLEKISKINGCEFEWNNDLQSIYSGKDYGVIAQEIEKVFPELVQTRENGYKAVKYDKLVSVLIEGIKELTKQVEYLKTKIEN